MRSQDSDYPGYGGSQLGWDVRGLWRMLVIHCVLIWELIHGCVSLKNPLNYTPKVHVHFSGGIFYFNEKYNVFIDKGGRIGSYEHKRRPQTAVTWYSRES